MIKIIDKKINSDELRALLEQDFGDMVKVVVDVEKGIVGIGGELHADAEHLMIKKGCVQKDLWGANIYPYNEPDHRIEYVALINIRPRQDNSSMEIQNPEIRDKVKFYIEKFVIGNDEKLV